MRHTLLAANNSGFTIPELLIVMTVSAIAMAMLFGPLNDLFKDNTTGLQSIIQTADTRGALRQIERLITASDGFLATNNITDKSTTGGVTYTWNWQGSSASSRVLITENYGKDGPDDSTGAANIVLNSPSCDITDPQTINYVYYVNNKSLYRKTITKQTYPAACGGVTVQQKRTCASGVNNPTYCQGNDALIVSGVSSFTVDYYSTSGSSVPLDSDGGTPPHTKYSAGTGSSVPGTAHTVVISIELTSGSGTNIVKTSSQMRITRINGN